MRTGANTVSILSPPTIIVSIKSTYYYRQHKVHQALNEQLNKQESQVEFAALPAPQEAAPANFSEEKIVLRQGDLVLEIPDGTSHETILSLLAGMKC